MFVCMCNYGKQIKFEPGSSAWTVLMFNLLITDFDIVWWLKWLVWTPNESSEITTSPDLSRQVGK